MTKKQLEPCPTCNNTKRIPCKCMGAGRIHREEAQGTIEAVDVDDPAECVHCNDVGSFVCPDCI